MAATVGGACRAYKVVSAVFMGGDDFDVRFLMRFGATTAGL